MSASDYRREEPVGYDQLHQKYINLRKEVLTNISTKFKQFDKSSEIEELNISSDKFIKQLDNLRSHYQENKSKPAIYINSQINNVLKEAIIGMQKVKENVMELKPDVGTALPGLASARIYMDLHEIKCNDLMKGLMEDATTHVATLQRNRKPGEFITR